MTYDPLIYTTYERFLLYQYNTVTEGLYYSSGKYFIYCPNVSSTTKSIDGDETIHKWLDNYRMMGQWISIVNELPQEYVRIDDQIYKYKPSGTGYIVTQPDTDYEIDLLIPKNLPNYEIAQHTPTGVVNFLEPITVERKRELQNIFVSNRFPYPVIFTDEPNSAPREAIGSFFETTISSRKAKKIVSTNLHTALEEDEDDWIANRNNILNSNSYTDSRPKSFQSKISRGFVDASLVAPDNMRNYLSLFEEVSLVPPVKNRIDEFLNGLGVTKDELLGLIELGRVHLLLPKSIENYELELVDGALERRRSNVHFTRRINTFTLQEMRKRNPLFFPHVSTLEKQILLRSVDESLSFLSGVDRNLVQKVIAEIGHGWHSVPNAMNETNVNFISQFGVVNILDAVLQYHTKKDFRIQLMASAPMVELAAATGSVLMPATEPGFDLSPFCQIIADFYSGIPNSSLTIPKPSYTNFAVEEILAVSKGVPILDFAKTFNGAEINRFRNIVMNISNTSISPEDLEATIEAFNYFVKQYEGDKSRISVWDISGYILGQMGKVCGVPFSSWIIKLLTKTVLKHCAKSEQISTILDSLDGQFQRTYPDSILVSRMRDKVKKKI